MVYCNEYKTNPSNVYLFGCVKALFSEFIQLDASIPLTMVIAFNKCKMRRRKK